MPKSNGCRAAVDLAPLHFDFSQGSSLITRHCREIDFSQAIRLNPRFLEAYFNRAYVLFRLGRLDESLVDYNRVITLAPDMASAYFNRSFPLAAKGLWSRALADVQKAMQLDPNNAKYREHLGDLQAAMAKAPPPASPPSPPASPPATPPANPPANP